MSAHSQIFCHLLVIHKHTHKGCTCHVRTSPNRGHRAYLCFHSKTCSFRAWTSAEYKCRREFCKYATTDQEFLANAPRCLPTFIRNKNRISQSVFDCIRVSRMCSIFYDGAYWLSYCVWAMLWYFFFRKSDLLGEISLNSFLLKEVRSLSMSAWILMEAMMLKSALFALARTRSRCCPSTSYRKKSIQVRYWFYAPGCPKLLSCCKFHQRQSWCPKNPPFQSAFYQPFAEASPHCDVQMKKAFQGRLWRQPGWRNAPASAQLRLLCPLFNAPSHFELWTFE